VAHGANVSAIHSRCNDEDSDIKLCAKSVDPSNDARMCSFDEIPNNLPFSQVEEVLSTNVYVFASSRHFARCILFGH
jgi:hypothetical protein